MVLNLTGNRKLKHMVRWLNRDAEMCARRSAMDAGKCVLKCGEIRTVAIAEICTVTRAVLMVPIDVWSHTLLVAQISVWLFAGKRAESAR